MTAAVLLLLAAAILAAAIWPLHRAARLERLLEAHDLEAMIDATRELPPLGDEHAGRLLRIVREDGETR